MLDTAQIVVLILVLSALAGAWAFMTRRWSTLSGWRDLAARYGVARIPAGYMFHPTIAIMGGLRMHRILRASITPEGLGLWCMGPFALNHTPLLIPWSEVGNIRDFAIGEIGYGQAALGRPCLTRLCLPSSIWAETVEHRAPRPCPVEPVNSD
jgi:hypothetical protein